MIEHASAHSLHYEYDVSISLQDTEIINTAILTGRTVAIPVKMFSIEMNGGVTDVSAFVQCKSTNEDIVKVWPMTSGQSMSVYSVILLVCHLSQRVGSEPTLSIGQSKNTGFGAPFNVQLI